MRSKKIILATILIGLIAISNFSCSQWESDTADSDIGQTTGGGTNPPPPSIIKSLLDKKDCIKIDNDSITY